MGTGLLGESGPRTPGEGLDRTTGSEDQTVHSLQSTAGEQLPQQGKLVVIIDEEDDMMTWEDSQWPINSCFLEDE